MLNLKIILSLLCIFISTLANAQKLSENDKEKLQIYVYEELLKKDFVKLNRLTTEGELSSCEIEFQHVYRDYRAKLGTPIVLTGSFSSTYKSGDLPIYLFKINAGELNLENQNWSIIAPPFINISINKLNFQPYKLANFVCETGGRCVGYGDSNLKILTAVTEATPFDAIMSWSLADKGIDLTKKLSDIGEKNKSRAALQEFKNCNNEINKKLIDFYEKKKIK